MHCLEVIQDIDNREYAHRYRPETGFPDAWGLETH